MSKAPIADAELNDAATLPSPLEMYRRMVTIRRFEETVADIYSRGIMVGLAHLYIGQEAVAVGVCSALRHDDLITSTHRGHGHLIAKGADLRRMFAEILGKRDGYNKGKGGSMHIADISLGILGANGIVGGGLGIATGAALSASIRETAQAAVAFFGDGAVNAGILYETMNLAALWRLPVIYVCENNQYGEYTQIDDATAGAITARAEAMNISATQVDGNDVVAVYHKTHEAVAQARANGGPSFIECLTYRQRGHHMGDTGKTYAYRTESEISQWMGKDPMVRFRSYLIEQRMATPTELDHVEHKAAATVENALAAATQLPDPGVQEVFEDVYA